MIQLLCPTCVQVPVVPNPDYNKPSARTRDYANRCPNCGNSFADDGCVRAQVQVQKPKMTSTFIVPKRNTEGTIVQISPNFVISTKLGEQIREVSAHRGEKKVTFKIVSRKMLLVWDVLIGGKATSMKALAYKMEGKDADERMWVKPYLLSNVEMGSGSICWGRAQISPSNLRIAESTFFSQPFNYDYFVDKPEGRRTNRHWAAALVNGPFPAIVHEGRTICSGCCMPPVECPCSAGARGESLLTEEQELALLVYRFRNFDPYKTDNRFKDVQWHEGKEITGARYVETDSQIDEVMVTVDPDIIQQFPASAVLERGDGTPTIVAFGLKQEPSGTIFNARGTLFFWDGKNPYILRRKRLRKKLMAAGIPNPVIP